MAINLFPHNQHAYDAVVEMLDQVGKAAVIHPTGTGKSFIGFKLCEDNPEKRFCWLSPSEYIFTTQLENLKDACHGCIPGNIQFITYSKLMLLDASQMALLNLDYIILDEFHRCGAEKWGSGVSKLLDMYPNAKVVGFSATNVRYLDNQRDMAVELFNRNIASEISLGAAIVNGILHPPKYVLATFQHQTELEKYKSRITRLKSKAARDRAEGYLEALRRTLEKADGLDVIFRKHMENPHGKYIVFCANFDHMQEMISLAHSWFSLVDSDPHIYSAYSEDPGTDQAFSEFKLDASNHLRLLYCIDMLNEGVHVDGIDGVILLRPTVSPIIYKQQIGRALSAGKKNHAVIFDIVQNIENLYSIGAIEDEMAQVIFLYRQNNQEQEIVHEHFHIIDELCDCMELFDRLNDSLTASWDLMYQSAKQYYQTFGDLEVPRRYITPEGYCLGSWLCTQRKVYSGKCPGILTDIQIERLSAIGMRWGDFLTDSWNMYYDALCRYKHDHGNLDILARYISPEGIRLGSFISNLRTCRASGQKNGYLTPERIAALDELGMIWGKVDFIWESNYLACAKYYTEFGNLNIPNNYVSNDGLKIGAWIRRQRIAQSGKKTAYAPLSSIQIQRLNEIGMVWEDPYTVSWNNGYASAVRFYQVHGHINVPSSYVDEHGFALGKWIRKHRERRKNGTPAMKITEERRTKLDLLGMDWGVNQAKTTELKAGCIVKI